MHPAEIKSIIDARIAIRQANQTIKTNRKIMQPKYQIDPEKMWNRFKSGDTERAFLISRAAKATIDLAAREVNALAGGPPSAAERESKAENAWRLARQGKGRDFYSNGDAKTVLFVAAVEFHALTKAKADTAAISAVIAKATAQPSKGSTAPAASKDDGLTISQSEFNELTAVDKAEFHRLGGKVINSPSAVKPPSPQYASNLTGFARVSAAFAKK